ncbi:acetyl-CoA synthetase [Plasmodium inui San Antonio 1]|uniref:acetate--CoA ligase n=1 Tax=Plasmodium inui San Antonio 1 TaxID=1237626 RepID=W7AT17_9APIC|nr:acetyl-CoA synthetase [Plasmodium inui San Antonio 1]EUD68591.1 acetyl-CoA synthetase [Plasmodium inui San Antonio 1]
MNTLESNGNITKVDSGQLNVIDIDQSIFLNKNSFPVNESYSQNDNKTGTNRNIKDVSIYKEMYEESINNPELFWGNIAKNSVRWFKMFTKVYMGNFKKGNISWFVNGKINACDNCVDRWVEKHPNKTAIIWEKDTPNDFKKISYQKLLERTCKIANLLKMYGVRKQDVVTIYLPMIPEIVYTMLACARIGAIHNVVFAGYSAGSLCDRILDSKSSVLITSDFGMRGGKLTKLKQIADAAMEMCGDTIKVCIVFKNKTKISDANRAYLERTSQSQLYHSTSFDLNGADKFLAQDTTCVINSKQNGMNQNLHEQMNNNKCDSAKGYVNCKPSRERDSASLYACPLREGDCVGGATSHHVEYASRATFANHGNHDNYDDQDNNDNYDNHDNGPHRHPPQCNGMETSNHCNAPLKESTNNAGTKVKGIHTRHKKICKNNNLGKKNHTSDKTHYSNEIDNSHNKCSRDGEVTNNMGDRSSNSLGKESCDYMNSVMCKSLVEASKESITFEGKGYRSSDSRESNFDENICTLKEGRDVDGSALIKNMRAYCPIEYLDSEDFLCILYTSGSTGKPKGVAHTTAGYLLYAYTTCKYIFDVTPNDIFGCVADIGWVTGHTYVLYGPLLNGITTILFSSIPTYPDCGRYWSLIETHKITQFYTAPTALRALMKHGDSYIEKYDLSSCRILGSVGEPINPETWRWYYNIVGKKRCVIVDTYWQTETGGIVIAPIPNLFKMKPGCATLPFFGVQLEILDSKTLEPLNGPNVCGLLCIKSPWPGMLRTVYGNHNRLVKTYFSSCPNYYFTGDGAYRDEDGYYWISGRIDDTLNVSGHRLGAAEIEHALVQHPCIAEAAVVSFPHVVKGEGILCFIVKKVCLSKKWGELKGVEPKETLDQCVDRNGNTKNANAHLSLTSTFAEMNTMHVRYTDEKIIEELKLYVRRAIGPIATPDLICIVPDLPKTRSGKIIRRILRCIANGLNDFGDITTVANYEVIDIIVNKFRDSKSKCQSGK